MTPIGYVIVLLGFIVVELWLVILGLQTACRYLEGIANGTDPNRVAQRYGRG